MLPGKTLALPDLLTAVRRRMILLAVPPVLGLFGVLLLSAQLPNMYQAEVLIAIVPQRVPDAFVRSTVTLRAEERLDAISVQVLSRALLEAMIREFDLYPRERAEYTMDDVVMKMRSNIQVIAERPRQGPRGPEPLHAFRIRYTYPDAQMVTRIAERLGEAFVSQNVRDRDALAEATSEFLQDQLVEARARLEEQEGRLEAFRERYGNALPTQLQTNLQSLQNTQLQIQSLVESTARDRDRQMMLQRLISEVENDQRAAPPPVAPAPGGQAAMALTATQQLAAARQNLAQLELKFTPEHPDVRRAKRLVQELEPKAAAEAAARASADEAALPALSREEQARRERLREMRAEVESLERQLKFKTTEEERLRGLAAQYQRRIEAVPGVEAEWTQLSRDYDSTKALYQDLLGKSEQSKVALDLERQQIGEQFRIVDPARVPTEPTSPVRYQISLIGLFVGLLLGVATAATLEYRDSSFRSESDVVKALSLPVLTIIPLVETERERAARGRRTRLALAVSSVAILAGVYVFWSMRLWEYLI
ncbi:MAG: hypothetical protein IT179_08980 [Acidobacteria bacterium]|nr:hypothetical protein [Acidobacteriota bacterium]